MKLLKLADRTVSVLGILLFGILTGLSLFSTIYYSTQYIGVDPQAGKSGKVDPHSSCFRAFLYPLLLRAVGDRGRLHSRGGSAFRLQGGGGLSKRGLFHADERFL